MAFTKVVGAGIHTLSNITSHNINSSGIITATKFVGPFDGTSGTFSGNVTIGGNLSVAQTVTYEDVKNVDSVGIGTFRQGVFIPDTKELKIGNTASSPDLKIYHNTSNTLIENSTGQLALNNSGGNISIKATDSNGDFILRVGGSTSSENAIVAVHNGEVILSFNGNTKLTTTNTGVTVTGTAVATTFSGSGASLTNLPAANLTGTLPAISGANLTNLPADTPTNSDIQVVYAVTANGSSAYRFAGNGVVSTADNPDLYLIRGKKYRFINNSGGSHPFQIRESSGGTAYSTGVTNNGAASGNIDFAPTFDSPAQLVYQCTSHGGMVGNIYLRGGSGGETNVGVITATGSITTASGTMTIGFQDHTSGNTSPTTATGYYERIGNMVHCSIDTGSIQKSSMQSGQILLLTGCFPITRDNNWHIAGSTYHYNVNTSANGGGHQVVAA